MAIQDSSPSELARETLRTLAARKLPPTPDHYASIFQEIAGLPPVRDPAVAGLAGALVRMIEAIVPTLGADDPYLPAEAATLVAECRRLAPGDSTAVLNRRLGEFNQRLGFLAGEQVGIRGTLLGLVQLMLAGVSPLLTPVGDLRDEFARLAQHCEPPLTLRNLDSLERRLQELLSREGELANARSAAHEGAHRLFLELAVHLGGLADETSARSTELAGYVQALGADRSVHSVERVIGLASSALEGVARHAREIGDEVSVMRRRLLDADAEIERLQSELEAAGQANRHDALTGALNRRGLDEELERTLGDTRVKGAAFSVALIDVDNFKLINDEHGHPAGDAALAHLAAMAREVMRVQDSLCRYGGEEFVILMPDTTLPDAIEAIRALQRRLTREIFLADEQRVLITFSAGVALLGPDEDPYAAIERADRGMYQAKRSGKNRVVAA